MLDLKSANYSSAVIFTKTVPISASSDKHTQPSESNRSVAYKIRLEPVRTVITSSAQESLSTVELPTTWNMYYFSGFILLQDVIDQAITQYM